MAIIGIVRRAAWCPRLSNGGEVMTHGGTRVEPVLGGVPGTKSGPAQDAPQPPRDR